MPNLCLCRSSFRTNLFGPDPSSASHSNEKVFGEIVKGRKICGDDAQWIGTEAQ
jgi:hypothetical protein